VQRLFTIKGKRWAFLFRDNVWRMNQDTGNNLSNSMNHPSLLLEIGAEEIPARFLRGAISDLKNIAARIFSEYRVDYKNMNTFGTPRRLVLIVEGLNTVQEKVIKEVFGPSRQAAFDSKGNPTKAAAGFANSLGIKISDLIIKQRGKGDYVAAVIEKKGLETKAVLPELSKKIILSLHFPKAMRWGDTQLSFVRPIHRILAIFGSEIVNFELDGLKSSNMTKGHRFLSPSAFLIKDIASFMNLLENNFVILDHEKRKNIIRNGIASLFNTPDRQPIIDEELLDTVNFLVEFPVPVLCSFSDEYLKLPKELLITVMKDHQKYFAVQDSKGNLINNFVVISNTRAENSGTVMIGAERVIKARFDDAKFYYFDDIKKHLSDRVENLKQVTFHDELGTLFEKTERVKSIAGFLSEKLDPSLKDRVTRAGYLSKSDLITGVVREFPELQGVMGKYYALCD
jgi:glycyl-tRNA synthetase beta chain